MKVIVTKENLNNALRKVISGVSSRPLIPILTNVLLHAEGDRMVIKASDSDISVTTWIPALVEEEGETTLPGKKLQQIITSFNVGDITIESDAEDNSRITSGPSQFTIHGLSSVDYPKENAVTYDWSFQMKTRDLARGIAMVVYARSVDTDRRQLNGVVMSIRSGMVTFAATDGRRLSICEIPLDDPNAKEGDYILPSRSSVDLGKCVEDGGDTITISLSSSCVSFESMNTTLVTKLVEGVYPNFRQVVPANCGNSVTVPRQNLINVMSRVSLVLTDQYAIKLNFTENKLTISANSAETGYSEESMDVAFTGEEVSVSFNPTFFLEPLKVMDVDNVTIEFGKQYMPVKLTGDDGFLAMVMPMRA